LPPEDGKGGKKEKEKEVEEVTQKTSWKKLQNLLVCGFCQY